MHLTFRGVNDAFQKLVERIHSGTILTSRCESRNGPVLQVTEPVLITYQCPKERVLCNPARNANPFFHLYEALWMLAGRNDVASVTYYNKRMNEYSDDGKTLNGAYGYRWRHSQVPDHQNWENGDGVDQLDVIVNHLKDTPTSRRAVLQMWEVESDLLKIGPGEETSRDTCCNLSVLFSLRRDGICNRNHKAADCPCPTIGHDDSNLDMTVTNRSNDMIWGMLGANFVHFSMLQEYMAARLGVEVGVYHHFTNNLHCYENNWKPEEWLKAGTSRYGTWRGVALVHDSKVFEEELPWIVEKNGPKPSSTLETAEWQEPFFSRVAQPMFNTFHAYKQSDSWNVEYHLSRIEADDWRQAATSWLRRRAEKRKEREYV